MTYEQNENALKSAQFSMADQLADAQECNYNDRLTRPLAVASVYTQDAFQHVCFKTAHTFFADVLCS